MGGRALPLWVSTKEDLDKLRAALQDYLCNVWGKCSITGIPNTVIIDTLVEFCLYKPPNVLFQATSEWLKRKGDKTGGRLTTVWARDETIRKLEELRNRIIDVFLEKARDINLSSRSQINELRRDLQSILTYARLFDIILSIFDVEKFVEEVAIVKKDRGFKVSPAYYRFINMVVEKAGSAIVTSDPYTRVMSFLKRVEEEETRRRRVEALTRRGKELLQRLEGRPIEVRLRIGEHGGYLIAVPQDIGLLRDLIAMLRASEKEKYEIAADVEFELGGKAFNLKGLRIHGFQSSLYEDLIPPGWVSGELPGIAIGNYRDLKPDLKAALQATPIDVDATIRIHRIEETL